VISKLKDERGVLKQLLDSTFFEGSDPCGFI